MSDLYTHPAAGIAQLTIETIGRNGVLRAEPDATEIQIVASSAEAATAAEIVVSGDAARFVGGQVTRVVLPPDVAVTVVAAGGDLRIEGLGALARVDTVEGDLRIDQASGPVTITLVRGDVRSDGAADLQIETCDGDCRFLTGGLLRLGTVEGDLRVSSAGDVRVTTIHGDVALENVAGAVHVEQVYGDARLSHVEKQAVLGQVRGDMRGVALLGGLSVAHVAGDLSLEGPFPAAEGYAVHAGGDAKLRLHGEDDVQLLVRAGGRIRANLPLTPTGDGTTTYTASLGAGSVQIALTNGGDLRIEADGVDATRGAWERGRDAGTDPFAELSTLGDRIRRQVAASLAAAGINPETGEINLGRGRAPRTSARWPKPAPSPERPKGVSESLTSEQLAILKMLEEGRITTDEADSLLRALGA